MDDDVQGLLADWRADIDSVAMPPMLTLQACLILLEATGRLHPLDP